MFDHFRLARYRITIAAGKYGLTLPPHKGSTFRGGFGRVFRRVTCALHQKECCGCLLREQCPYAYIFETAPPRDTRALSKYESVPRPFVIEPPEELKTEYAPGETLAFHLLLIGRAIDYLPYFIVAFRELEEVGIGRGLRPFQVLDITAIGLDRSETIYISGANTVRGVDLTYTGGEVLQKIPARASKISIKFETPFWLKDQGRLAPVPEFHIFFRQAMRRISALSYFHHGQPLLADYAGLTSRSRQVRLTENNTHWQDWERYSRRQKQRITLGGLLGEVIYEGDLTEFLPWLAIGEQVHVGKNTVFGLGKYLLTVNK
ncbi:MAG TPA: CRISPR system precrRNA processing endoribonuclease RAMP protein Cas6 [Bacillota bacterium]|nr:CRISPR system precrRNA processing endoribonuclease RAMP protein Cas6 [Bacillota bacterium]